MAKAAILPSHRYGCYDWQSSERISSPGISHDLFSQFCAPAFLEPIVPSPEM
jgi:hypothetical protein